MNPLTSLAVIPSETRGRAKMQKTVTPRLTRSTWSRLDYNVVTTFRFNNNNNNNNNTDTETDGHGRVITVALRCGGSIVNWPFAAAYQLATLRVCPAT